MIHDDEVKAFNKKFTDLEWKDAYEDVQQGVRPGQVLFAASGKSAIGAILKKDGKMSEHLKKTLRSLKFARAEFLSPSELDRVKFRRFIDEHGALYVPTAPRDGLATDLNLTDEHRAT